MQFCSKNVPYNTSYAAPSRYALFIGKFIVKLAKNVLRMCSISIEFIHVRFCIIHKTFFITYIPSKPTVKCCGPDFTGSNGCIDRLKHRHGIDYRQISGEAKSVDKSPLAAWIVNILPTLLKDYPFEDVYNADEFGLFFKLMSDKSLVFNRENCHGDKLSTNTTGTHKVNLLAIGKSRSPQCFKNGTTFPCEYTLYRIGHDLFISWIQRLDIFFGRKKKKILLFVDNCPAQPKILPKTVKLVFLPPNATSRAQPLDQGIIKVVKQIRMTRMYI